LTAFSMLWRACWAGSAFIRSVCSFMPAYCCARWLNVTSMVIAGSRELFEKTRTYGAGDAYRLR